MVSATLSIKISDASLNSFYCCRIYYKYGLSRLALMPTLTSFRPGAFKNHRCLAVQVNLIKSLLANLSCLKWYNCFMSSTAWTFILKNIICVKKNSSNHNIFLRFLTWHFVLTRILFPNLKITMLWFDEIFSQFLLESKFLIIGCITNCEYNHSSLKSYVVSVGISLGTGCVNS